MTPPDQSDCKTCGGRGYLRKGTRLIECPQCLGQVRVEDLSPEDRKT